MCPLIPINCDFLKIIPIAKETEFELQSMKKDTAGTAELLDQFYRVEVGHQQDFLVEDKNDSISNFDRAIFCRICSISTTWGSPTPWSI